MDKAKAQQVLARIEEILRWEQRMEEHKDQKFAELGKHLCEVRDQKYWRLGYASFEAYLEKKFPDGRRKAYYLMSIHDHLKQIPTRRLRTWGGRRRWSWRRWRAMRAGGSTAQPGWTKRNSRASRN